MTMLRNIIALAVLASPVLTDIIMAQESGNYILKETKISNSAKVKSYQYFDGLGRRTAEATNGISNNGVFTYTFHEILGEQLTSRNWLPVVGGTTIANMTLSDISQQSSSQYSDASAYENFEYDALGRVRQQYKAGQAWKTRPATVTYVTNTADDVKRYSFSGDEQPPVCVGYYSPGTLYGTRTTNEDNVTSTTYIDAFGKKILERRGTGNDTYYIYDDLDMLAFVLMPEHQNDSDIGRHAFQYQYDLHGNIVRKTLPGCEPIEYCYERGDRCVSIQDGELRKRGLYRFRLYDKVGRMVIQGLSSTMPDYYSDWIVSYNSNSEGVAGTGYELTSGASLRSPLLPPPEEPLPYNCLNLTIESIEIVNYYDDYSFLGGTNMSVFSDMTPPAQSFAKGMLTGSIILASNGERTAVVNTYDLQGNLTEVQEKGLNGSLVNTANTYTYTNKIATSEVTVQYPGADPVVFNVSNTYNPKNDHLSAAAHQTSMGQLSTVKHTTTFTYDQFGRVVGINRPVSNGSLTYQYDIHGWVTNITSGSFNEHLYYNDGAGAQLYSGNISSMTWNTGGQNKGYRFTYDALNRLTNAKYGENNFASAGGHFDERVTYDGNGNITTLVRNGLKQNGSYGVIDSLAMMYDGNQLYNVDELAAPVLYTGSIDLKEGSMDIQYNSNGSLVCDGTRGITHITYDDFNNPVRIQFDNGNVTKYVYSATGQKLRTIHYTAVENTHVSMGCDLEDIEDIYLAVDSTDYLLGGSVIYVNEQLSKILFDGGYVDASYAGGPHLSYKYYNRDHLGNNREVVDENGTILQRTDYYPFGTPFSSPSSTINAGLQPFKYNNKELDMMHGLNTYDYGARQYYPLLPMWDRLDPLAEDNPGVSPYVYCNNNPVMLLDLNGCKPDSLEAAMMSSLAYEANSEYTAALNNQGWYEYASTITPTGFKSIVFRKKIGEGKYEYCLSFAGTDTNSGFVEFSKDAITDILNFCGVITPQYVQSAIQALKMSVGKISNSVITYTGHSLGGGLATFASNITGNDAIIFNPASISGNMGTIAKFISFFQGGHITQYRSCGDYVNFVQNVLNKPSSGKIIMVDTGKKMSHSIDDIINTFLRK